MWETLEVPPLYLAMVSEQPSQLLATHAVWPSAYIVPPQESYAAAEGLSDPSGPAAAALRSFVSRGGSLVLMGGRGDARAAGALAVLAALLRRDPGCRALDPGHSAEGSGVTWYGGGQELPPLVQAGAGEGVDGAAFLPLVEGLEMVTVSAEQLESGDVAFLTCDEGGPAGPLPWFQARDPAQPHAVAAAWGWALGRGRLFWVGVPDPASAPEWLAVLAAAATALPLPAPVDGHPEASPPAAYQPSPAPVYGSPMPGYYGAPPPRYGYGYGSPPPPWYGYGYGSPPPPYGGPYGSMPSPVPLYAPPPSPPAYVSAPPPVLPPLPGCFRFRGPLRLRLFPARPLPSASAAQPAGFSMEACARAVGDAALPFLGVSDGRSCFGLSALPPPDLAGPGCEPCPVQATQVPPLQPPRECGGAGVMSVYDVRQMAASSEDSTPPPWDYFWPPPGEAEP
ncbi:hypothetical protein HYH03_016878 [Edaphochlamys debaryana]|uniref:Uncharacterized protein n=1 Tax=Edaphochlamys debaryana TaxID=47281 RepID=A0A835XIB6_9CHLO|nr:hypothetical protein HYH03_016878 [Edaphochlamys debaryana]|eukprot:KAG2484336.1 hypothetical protein HYH03_016878 [Edaphochlamys debaryana]